jgi:hypothetical protein
VTAVLALDQAFPIPVMNAVGRFLPEVELVPLRRIDNRLIGLGDRDLVLALHQLGWTGLITTNARLLRSPAAVAALVATELALVVIDGVDDDPLRATGALLLALPGVLAALAPGEPKVVSIRSGAPTRSRAPELLARLAARQRRDVAEVLAEHGLTDEELTRPVLPSR